MNEATIPTMALLRNMCEDIIAVAAKHGVSNIRVVGSVARGEATPDSDVDLLMTLPPGQTVFDLVGIWLDLQDLLGFPVSVIPDTTSDVSFMATIQNDAVPL
jgi:predicted nucleotidyltransferase